MDAGIATVIAAVIGAGASIAVAFIATRSHSDPQVVPPPVRHPFQISRVIKWVLVSLIYLVGGFFFFGAFWSLFQDDADASVFLTQFILGTLGVLLGYWAQRRITARPQSN
jgi:putative flippase GtrA